MLSRTNWCGYFLKLTIRLSKGILDVNPTTYLGHTLTWEKGRQLKSFDSNTYTYNANGIRTSKTVNGVKHTYTLDGVKILRETWGDNTLIPLYDNEDSVCGILYNDTPYYFLKNLQGDIIAITNQNGQTVAQYRYDAWGKCTITSDTSGSNIPGINPFRYRSYYYDPEIGMYYLQSRYYDSAVGRFLNSDTTDLLILSHDCLLLNLFAYCSNNSVNSLDLTGYAGFKDLWKAIKDSFGLVKSIADQAYNACQTATPIKQIKKLSKKSGKSQRQIKRELKKLAKETERCYKRFKIAGIVMSVISTIIFAVSYLQNGKTVFADIYALIVEQFIEALSWFVCKIAELGCKAIFAFGVIIGFGVSWLIGKIISAFFRFYVNSWGRAQKE